MEEALSCGLLQTAAEMGGALTEAGAISAVAAFFRRNMDACAWTEEATLMSFTITTSAPPGAPPLLRFSLRSAHRNHRNDPFGGIPRGSTGDSDSARTAGSSPDARGRPSASHLELVVSRGPGPDFSAQEARVASQAAVLLSQALASVRDRAALSEANEALEKSFRGMEEASEAVAVLVEERDRRAQHEEAGRAELHELHERAMSAAAEELETACRAAEELRRQLAEAGEAVATVARAAEDVCRAVAAVAGAPGAGDLDGRGGADEDGEESAGDSGAGVSELVAVIEGAARRALRCSHARVTRARIEGKGAVQEKRRGWRESGPLPRQYRRDEFTEPSVSKGLSLSGGADGNEGGREHRADERDTRKDEASSPEPTLQVPVPHLGGTTGPLILSINGAPDPARGFRDEDGSVASALAACLGTALQALRQRQRARRLARRIEADGRARAETREAEAACTAEAEVEARERGERAVAGMRALALAAEASRAQAQAKDSAARRARRQIDALRHLLLRLGGAGEGHAAVAGAVDKLAGQAVPGCEGAVLLTPRREERGEKSGGTAAAETSGGRGGVTFAPDPRAWAAAAVSRVRREDNGLSKRESRRVEKAAAEAADTGEAMCVMIGRTAEFAEGSSGGDGDGGGAPRWSRVIYFSPVVAAGPPASERRTSRKDTPERAAHSGRMRTIELEGRGTKANDRDGDGAIIGTVCTPCLIAWVLCLDTGSSTCGADEEEDSAGSATPSSLTENVASSACSPAAADAMPVSPPPLPLPPHVSEAMEAVVHAVRLALSAAAAASAAHRVPNRPGLLSASRRASSRQLQSTKGDLSSPPRPPSKEGRRERKHRDAEIGRLRDGTASLTERVRGLEIRAATLRASEARSAAALARARADVGAVTGQLQLTALERDRLLRRLEETGEGGAPLAATARRGKSRQGREGGNERREPLTATSAGNVDVDSVFRAFSRAEREGSGRVWAGAFRPFGTPSSTTGIGGGFVGTESRKHEQAAMEEGTGSSKPGLSASLAEDNLYRGDRSIGVEKCVTGGGGGGRVVGVVKAKAPQAEAGSLGALSIPSSMAENASSQALQGMASIHARLSDSLKRGASSLAVRAA